MAKYISSIKDLTIQAMTNGSKIETDAKKNRAEACFKMGMVYLLGISSAIDFKKATIYFGNQSLTSNSDANRLLGFIAECERNYSEAFKYYIKANDAVGKGENVPLYNKVFEERNHLQEFFKENGLPSTVLNKDVSAILNEYVKGGTSRFDASAKIATICNDELSCLEVAQILFDMEDYHAAKRWLLNGNIPNTNELYVSIEEKRAKTKNSFTLPDTIEIIEIENFSLLEKSNTESSIIDLKQTCDETAKLCIKEWKDKTSSIINIIKKKYEEEKAREEEEHQRALEEQAAIEKIKQEKIKKIINIIGISIMAGIEIYILANYNGFSSFIIKSFLNFIIAAGIVGAIESALGIEDSNNKN